LDEAEDSLEREKKSKGDIEKIKRKIEGDLKLTQETVSDLDRVKCELNQSVQRKEKESAAIAAKIEDEATLGSKYSKQIKELQARLEELDEELIIERGNRAKAEKSRTILKKDIEDLGSRLEEAGANTATQVELNKKREGELGRLKGELEEINIAHEGTLAALRMKHNNTMAELGEQIDNLNGNKVKAEKDKAGMERDLQEARSTLEDAVREKAEMDKNGKLLQGSIVDTNQKLDEMARALNEADSQILNAKLRKVRMPWLSSTRPRSPLQPNLRIPSV
jgi:chromosome segregation ATPase